MVKNEKFPLRLGIKQGCLLFALSFNMIPGKATTQEKEIKNTQIGTKIISVH